MMPFTLVMSGTGTQTFFLPYQRLQEKIRHWFKLLWCHTPLSGSFIFGSLPNNDTRTKKELEATTTRLNIIYSKLLENTTTQLFYLKAKWTRISELNILDRDWDLVLKWSATNDLPAMTNFMYYKLVHMWQHSTEWYTMRCQVISDTWCCGHLTADYSHLVWSCQHLVRNDSLIPYLRGCFWLLGIINKDHPLTKAESSWLSKITAYVIVSIFQQWNGVTEEWLAKCCTLHDRLSKGSNI